MASSADFKHGMEQVLKSSSSGFNRRASADDFPLLVGGRQSISPWQADAAISSGPAVAEVLAFEG